ncbi:MAG: tyrosine-type recombinase/integrase [Planctomycetes bacterium]|nr:tyrosine-type recombinase/integrase [Planctomycetota bacterium]
MANSTKSPATLQRAAKPRKPAKPYPDFPLFPHATRRWAKKIRGKMVYFGPWAEPDKALDKWLSEKDYLLAGKTPPSDTRDGWTIHALCNHFCEAKEQKRDAGELSPLTFTDYHRTCANVMKVLGRDILVEDLRPDDFSTLRGSLAKRLGPVSIGNEIQRVRVLFKHAYDYQLIAKPVHFGPGFKRPDKKVLRLARAAKGPRMFEAADLRNIIDKAGVPLKAMILLGINCGFGNQDCGSLPLTAVDTKKGWMDYPRPKTGIHRRCHLWPETIEAINKAIAERPVPKTEATAGLLFVTKYGQPWAKDIADSPVTKEFRKVLEELKIHRAGLGFYALRHTFETIAGATRDQVAVDSIMGHADPSMGAAYREGIGDDRLKAVTDHVHNWLFPPKKRKAKRTKPR